MKLPAGTIGFKDQFQLQCRAFLIPWVEKKSAIACLKNRDYSSSSVPVRYIPKKSSQSKKSETLKVSKRKDISEFAEASLSLDNKVGFGGNFVQKRLDFEVKPQYWSRMRGSNLHFNDVEQDNAMEEPEDVSTVDNVMQEPEELSIHQRHNICGDQDVFKPLEFKTKNVVEKFATSQGGNVVEKSFNFDVNPLYQNQMLVSKVLFNDVEQDNIIEEPEEVANDDDILEEREEELDGVLTEKLSIHQQNRYCEHNVLKLAGNKTKRDAEEAAVKLLATRAFTTVELRKKLRGKRIPLDIVDAVISDLQSRGFLNDSWLAEAFCQSRWSSSTWGPRRIKQELSRKGVSKVDTEKAIQVVFGDGESDEYRHGLSKTSMDRLYVQASKQWLRGYDVPKETRKARIIRWLLYRGFTWDVIGFIVKKLESDH